MAAVMASSLRVTLLGGADCQLEMVDCLLVVSHGMLERGGKDEREAM
jgi:hypothetical protein